MTRKEVTSYLIGCDVRAVAELLRRAQRNGSAPVKIMGRKCRVDAEKGADGAWDFTVHNVAKPS